jgi:hypothetical protein
MIVRKNGVAFVASPRGAAAFVGTGEVPIEVLQRASEQPQQKLPSEGPFRVTVSIPNTSSAAYRMSRGRCLAGHRPRRLLRSPLYEHRADEH